jgi:hypothetical protein
VRRSVARALHAFLLLPTAYVHTVCVFECMLCCGVGVEVGQSGAGVERLRHRWCAHCTRRLDRCKGKEYQLPNDAGVICQHCYDVRNGRVAMPATPVKRVPVRDTPLLQTPERLTHLKVTAHAQGLGKQGRSRSAQENALMLLHLHETTRIAAPDTPPNQIIASVARSQLTSPNTVRKAAELYRDRMQLTLPVKPQSERIKPNDPRHANYLEKGPPLGVETLLYQLVAAAQSTNTHESLRTLKNEIREQLSIEVSTSTLHYWMVGMGLKYGRKKLSGLTAEVAAGKIRKFLLEYATAVKEEKEGKCVIVWMDESYVHQHYCRKFAWFLQSESAAPNRYVGRDSGARLLIIHGMTKDGMLQLAKSNDPSTDLSEEYPNAMVVARWVSAEGVEPADYHDTVDGEKFTAWMQNRLIPAFKRKYRGKQMVLIMDNASFHHAKGPDWYTSSEMNRGQCADFLRQINVCSIHGEVRGQERRFTSSTYSADDGPTLKLMRAEIDKWLESHPETNVEVPTQLIRSVKAGSRIIYTPPYESWLQPIELVWNQAKQQVAQGARKDRKLHETEEATKAALQGITKEVCEKNIRHVQKLINVWLKTSDAGWLGAYKSFEQLVEASVEERDAVYRSAMNGERNDQRSSDDKENQQEEAAASGSDSGTRKRQRRGSAHNAAKSEVCDQS